MKIGIKQLLQATELPEATIAEILAKENDFSQEQISEIEAICWDNILQKYQAKVKFELQKKVFEMADGKADYSEEDFTKAKEDLFKEVLNKLQVADDKVKIEEVRKQLKQPN